MSSLDQIRQECEQDLFTYAQMMFPDRYFGDVHQEMFGFFQESLMNVMESGDGDNSCALIPRDHQKALALYSRIATPQGWVKMGDIREGDLVFGKDGLPKVVQKLHPIVEQAMFEVELDDGRTVHCNEEHLWEVTCPSNTGQKEVVKPLKDIRKNYISNRFDKRNGKSYNEYRYFITAPDPVRYPKRDLPIDPYTLGMWLGDGHSSAGYITTADPEILDYIPYKNKKLKAKYVYKIEGLKEKLIDSDLLYNKHIPDLYLTASYEQRVELLQGLIDSDGHVHKTNKNLSYTTISLTLAKGVCELVRSLGGKAKLSNQFTKTHKESDVKHHSYAINIWLPDEVQPCKLKRKLERVQKGQRTKSAIVKIEYIGEKPARCMTVEDGIFLADDYMKTHNSFCIAVALSWVITKHPWITCVYVSSNPNLTEKQLQVIKNVFTSQIHRDLWPKMLNYEKGRTGKQEHKPLGTWTKTEIEVDHPDRPKSEKDPTVMATSAKSTNTGSHFKICVFDDLVTNENYASVADREALKEVSQSFASIATTGSIMWAVGTRYGEDDLYTSWADMTYDIYDDTSGELVETRPVWKFFERKVENSSQMDGSGEYVWPRQKWGDGWYGFNRTELSRKKAQMLNLELFYCQYYNTANAVATDKINRDSFMYASKSALENKGGNWYYADKLLKLHCGMDLNFTEGLGIKKKKRDSTAISVIGWDADGYLYVLEQRRFQTDKPEVYYKNLMELHDYWGFREATIESNVGGSVVVRFIKDEIRKDGRTLVVTGVPSTQNKQEKIAMTIEPLYRNGSVYHFKGGYTRELEEELRLTRPPHDDLKDSLAIAVNNSTRQNRAKLLQHNTSGQNVVNASCRFGGSNRRRRA